MDLFVSKTGEQLVNFINCNENLGSLKRKLEDLNCLREDVESRKLFELRPGKKLKRQVENWFSYVEKINGRIRNLEEEAASRNSLLGGFLGRKVLKMKEEVEGLIQAGSFADGLAVDEPARIGQVLVTTNITGEAIKSKLNDIVELLMDDKIGRIGVCGMGGVGKTTVIKEVNNQILKRTDKFDVVIWVTVSKEMDVVKLQNDIAKQLNVDLSEEEDVARRAGMLWELLAKKRRFVIILDDLWDKFLLEDVGFPEPCNGSKLVITTRSLDVCSSMDLKVVKIEPLSEDDAWSLFLEKVGGDILNHGLESIAKLVAAECAGLPLAIITLASSMKGRYEASEWRNALNELKQHVKGVHQNDEIVFQRLRFSYDRLNDSRVQNCFLCCALYPEDCEFMKEELVMYWIREGLLDEMQSMRAKFDRGHAILNKLISNCLLENCAHAKRVKMHDLVRDMALHIQNLRFLVKAKIGLSELPDEEEWTEYLEKVSLMNNAISYLPMVVSGRKCQMLTTLLLSRNHIRNVPDSFLEQMPKLKVLDLSWNPILRLPDSITKLTYLTSLVLQGCTNLEKLPSFSDLRALKHLDLYYTNIKQTPEGLQMLTNLLYLDLRSKTRPLQIPDGMISGLSLLQHLFVHVTSSVVKEVMGLKRLETFVGWFDSISDFNVFAFARRNMCLHRKWSSKYHNKVCLPRTFPSVRSYSKGVSTLQTNDTNTIQIEDFDIEGFIMVPDDVHELTIHRCKILSLSDICCFEDALDLRNCEISECGGMKCLFSRWCPQLRSLHHLKLSHLQHLTLFLGAEAVTSSVNPIAIFPCLTSIFINACGRLKKLFKAGWFPHGLQNLEEIHVEDFKEIEEMIESTGEEDDNTGPLQIPLPKLQKLHLYRLPELKRICGKNVDLICNSLQEIIIQSCGSIKTLFTRHYQLHGFRNLEEIYVRGCHNMEEILESDCETAQVPEISTPPMKVTSFPKLRKLDLASLPELRNICSTRKSLACNTVEEICIRYCPKLKRLPLLLPQLDDGQPTPPPMLQKICIYPRKWMDSADWNHPNAKDVLKHLIRFESSGRGTTVFTRNYPDDFYSPNSICDNVTVV